MLLRFVVCCGWEAMFAIGETYEVGMVIYGEEGPSTETHHNCVVAEVQGAVVRFRQFGKDWIVHTSSPIFVEARMQNA